MSDLSDDLQHLEEFWSQRATKLSDDCAKVDTSARSQRMRFEGFLQFNDVRGRTLLDVGCGVGDLYADLQRRGIACDYCGFDLSSEMAQRCRERFPDAEFFSGDFLQWEPGQRFDFVAAIAIHNVKVSNAWEILRRTTERQFALCNTAAHLSLLTDRHKGFDPHIQAWCVEEVLTMALEITPFVLLRHEYLPHDFGVTLYREPLIDTRPDLLLD